MRISRHPRCSLPTALVALALFLAAIGPTQALDPSAIIGGDRALVAWMNVGEAYRLLIDSLRRIDTPEGAKLKSEIQTMLSSAVSNFGRAKTQAQGKSCQANMRTVASAIELYLLDHNNPPSFQDLDLDLLVREGYLQGRSECPGKGKYSIEGDLAKNGEIICSVHGSVAHPAKAAQETNEEAAPEVGMLVQKVLEFDAKGLFRPKGRLWIAADLQQGFGLFLEADCQPAPLLEFARTQGLPPLPSPESSSDQQVVFRLPARAGEKTPGTLTIARDGLLLNAFQNPAGTVDSAWKELVDLAQDSQNSLAVEVSGEPITRQLQKAAGGGAAAACRANMKTLTAAVEMYNMDHPATMKGLEMGSLIKENYLKTQPVCGAKGVYSSEGDLVQDGKVVCSVHHTVDDPRTVEASNPDPLWKALMTLQKVRLVIGRKECRLAAAFGSPEALAVLKPQLLHYFDIGKPLALKAFQDKTFALPAEIRPSFQPFKDFLNGLTPFDRDPWLGIAAPGMPAESALVVPAVTGILAAIAIPNFKKARDDARNRACQANLRILLGALEMYEMDAGKPLPGLDFRELAAKGILKDEPKCPDGGSYSGFPSKAGHGLDLSCSVHGPLKK